MAGTRSSSTGWTARAASASTPRSASVNCPTRRPRARPSSRPWTPAGSAACAPSLGGPAGDLGPGRIGPAYSRYPLVLGHEWSGTVAGPADGDGLAPGARVVGEGIVPCGHCPRCRAGQTNLCLTYDELGFTRDGAA